MILKKKFVKREIGGDCILVPVGQVKFNGIITLNNIASFIWENYEKAKDEDELLGFILDAVSYTHLTLPTTSRV